MWADPAPQLACLGPAASEEALSSWPGSWVFLGTDPAPTPPLEPGPNQTHSRSREAGVLPAFWRGWVGGRVAAASVSCSAWMQAGLGSLTFPLPPQFWESICSVLSWDRSPVSQVEKMETEVRDFEESQEVWLTPR